jgi:anaphase-promoting complex subunit 4
LSIPYLAGRTTSSTDEYPLDYSPHNPSVKDVNLTVLSDTDVPAAFSKYTISTEDSFVPERMEVRKSKPQGSQNEDTMRIVFLGKDRLRYKVYKYPAQNHHKIPDEDISMS